MRTHLRSQFSPLLIVALLITTALTLARFNQSLWSDEATSVWFARRPLNTLFTALCDPHPPGYYVLLKAWLIGGDAENWLRGPSLLAGLLTVVVTYRLGRERCGKMCAGLAALLLALQPIHGWYAGEVRMYAIVNSLGLVAVWIGWRILSNVTPSRTGGLYVTYVVIAAFALWIDYSAMIPLGVLQLIWLASGRPFARRWLIVQMTVVALIVLVGVTPHQIFTLSGNIYPIFLAIQAAKLGLSFTPSAASLLLQLATGAGVLLATAVAIDSYRRPLWQRPWAHWAFVGVWMVVLVISTVPQAFTIKRRLVLVLPYLALATAYALTHWHTSIAGGVVIAQVACACLALYTLQREPWRSVVEDLNAAAQTSDVIWVDELSVPAFDYYWRRNTAIETASWMPLFSSQLPDTPQLAPQPDGALWLVTAESDYHHLAAFLPIEFWRNYQLKSERHTLGIGVYRYQRRIQPDPTVPAPPEPSRADAWGLLLLSPLDTCTR